jgi:hypothetical protein
VLAASFREQAMSFRFVEDLPMKYLCTQRAAMALMLSVPVTPVTAQIANAPTLPTAPPNVLLLVHQQFRLGSESTREKYEIEIAKACRELSVPNQWIDLQSITGAPEALFFDPLDSFEQLDYASAAWGRINAVHPELVRLQEEIRKLETSERTTIAVRRSDLSYRAGFIDLSKARYMRVLEVQLSPGHEEEFVEAFRTLRAAYEKIKADTPWVVYQVNVGMPSPTFFAFVPMSALKQNDDLLAWRGPLRDAEGQAGADRMQQIAREAYRSTESNLYAIHPEMSHVSKEFADGDPGFWSSRASGDVENSGKEEAHAAASRSGGEAKHHQ